MTTTTSSTVRPTALAACELAHAALLDALLDAEMGNWRTTEQTFDAAAYILNGARMLPNRLTAREQVAARLPLLSWSDDADGWTPAPGVRAAIRGDRALAASLIDSATAR